ncbi:hypothetical protein Lfu02_02170 [Longispora fulva]|uniref:Putative NAD(P)/FAD-binding protein YdhS n=1 Tax=Longispora fulva TaxID=619741 RepID=A0A8J7KP52_9ACTN|nr:FAD/NAD(P)-binding protein [Longispora fulva]MBG6135912.1 putative NAD(P)/FAD-binding protein YdhS [Longispora fulva]GIG55845.1 hypothetical protein Lfu02_02170 [Longispora fulva]
MRLAVIGGGAAAVSLLDSLLRHLDGHPATLDITVYEGSGTLATGRAYRPDLDCALVNRQAGYMSARWGDREHFLRWLREQGGRHADAEPESFVPRSDFGRYLTGRLAECVAAAEGRGWRVDLRAALVHEVAPAGEGVLLRGDGWVSDADALVLCVGSAAPGDPYRLAGAPGFHPDPYPMTEVLPRVLGDGHVLVLGTGLSGVDAALGLLHLGHTGPITMLSRRGILPGVRAVDRPMTLRHLTPERLAAGPVRLREVWRLFRADLREAGADPRALVGPVVPAADRLRGQLAASDNPAQSLMMAALHSARLPVWTGLPDAEKRLVLARFQPVLKSTYNPMPPHTARRLLAAMDSGQLSVRPGVTAVTHRPDRGFVAEGPAAPPPAAAVIDSTRVGLAVVGAGSRSLVSSVVTSGLGEPSPYGGLRVDVDSHALLGGGHPAAYAIGDITSGELYYAGSMFMVNRAADAVAAAITARVTSARATTAA